MFFSASTDQDFLKVLHETPLPKLDDFWRGSPFEELAALPHTRRAHIVERLLREWFERQGLPTGERTASGHDLIVNGWRVEVKSSLLRYRTRRYPRQGMVHAFQSIRPDNEYDFLLLLGLCPFAIRCWVIPACDVPAEPSPPFLMGTGGFCFTVGLGGGSQRRVAELNEKYGGSLQAAAERLSVGKP